MSDKKEIVLRFNMKTGEARIEAFGFKGSGCQAATKFLQEALGEMTDFQKKSEYFEASLEVSGHIDTSLCG